MFGQTLIPDENKPQSVITVHTGKASPASFPTSSDASVISGYVNKVIDAESMILHTLQYDIFVFDVNNIITSYYNESENEGTASLINAYQCK